ncbi:MAG TPA: 23S rRNA (adenine(2503)-C(2))-methyltransferase RlmN [Terriglobales bacterium]|jgi:23S rRNA (adenine2503-C2)-methyltransferase|nr:23S rRNA (adenine(2503)-C(2))-methyltransferase RlmN [Terriglobales bacterium]
MAEEKPTALLGLNLRELTDFVEEEGEPSYRGRQLFEALYRQRFASVEQISTLPQDFRHSLSQRGLSLGTPSIDKKFVSSDGTVRYLIGFADGQSVETVWMPEGDDGESGDGSEAGNDVEKAPGRARNRATICVSSQVGCAVDCQFCLTALLGVKRNLAAGEIVGQVCAVLNDQSVFPPQERVNIVFMGMGEPFLNYENFIRAVGLLAEGVGIPESRMTVSTAGIVPRIYDLGVEPVRPKLAISLNASNDEIRSRLMPINRKWNLEKLVAAARDFPLRNRERLTFEYVLLDGVNDSAQNARELSELVRGVQTKVNLIALNPGPGIAFQTPAENRVRQFQEILIASGLPTFIRRPRGRDIYAACGQLKRTVELAAP